jgi:protein-disulfide isomerase
VPVAVGGNLFFTFELLLIWGSRGKSRIKDSAPPDNFAESTLALAMVLYLAYASFFILKEVCPLCVATYVAVIGVFVVSGGASSVPMSRLPRRAVSDIRVLVATPLALVIALLFIAGASWGMRVFPQEQLRPVVAQAPAISASASSEFERWWDVQPRTPNFPFGNDGVKVLIVEFADYQCPQCRLEYFALKPILDKYAERPTDVKWLLKQYPLNSECNPSVPASFQSHPASCAAAAAAVMGRSKGMFDKMTDWLFLHQAELTPAVVRSTAPDLLKIRDFDAQYPKAIQEVKTEAAAGAALSVSSTPTFFINGRRIPGGGLPPQYFEAAIELELKRAK